jgi:pyruvate dehydrogenase E2 component (dihydrolipoamide acetyltransferase)
LSGGTFRSQSGDVSGGAFTPVINLPEAAILGVGRIVPKPVVKGEEIVIRKMLTLSLVFDHRLSDGAPAARFLDYICELIEEPYLLFLTQDKEGKGTQELRELKGFGSFSSPSSLSALFFAIEQF